MTVYLVESSAYPYAVCPTFGSAVSMIVSSIKAEREQYPELIGCGGGFYYLYKADVSATPSVPEYIRYFEAYADELDTEGKKVG